MPELTEPAAFRPAPEGAPPSPWLALHIFYAANPQPLLVHCVRPLVDLLQRVSVLADVPEVDHLLLNPVIVSYRTAWVVDATAEVRPELARAPDDLRRLDC